MELHAPDGVERRGAYVWRHCHAASGPTERYGCADDGARLDRACRACRARRPLDGLDDARPGHRRSGLDRDALLGRAGARQVRRRSQRRVEYCCADRLWDLHSDRDGDRPRRQRRAGVESVHADVERPSCEHASERRCRHHSRQSDSILRRQTEAGVRRHESARSGGGDPLLGLGERSLGRRGLSCLRHGHGRRLYRQRLGYAHDHGGCADDRVGAAGPPGGRCARHPGGYGLKRSAPHVHARQRGGETHGQRAHADGGGHRGGACQPSG